MQKSYRIRTDLGQFQPSVLTFDMKQNYDFIEVLSLTLDQKNLYKLPSSGYGVIAGRVVANGNFGIPNAKVSVFVPFSDATAGMDKKSLYEFYNVTDTDKNGVRYNLLQENPDACHADIGTFPLKNVMLDDGALIEIFDDYWKYTTTTNNGGDYMLYGIPVGTQTVHVDVDLSDIGILSQRPTDMIYKGYNINQFENPSQFKKSTNLDTLCQIMSQNNVVQVYPFWGDTSDNPLNCSITRLDVEIPYKFEPTCVFIGSIFTDKTEASINHKCKPSETGGKMSDLTTGEGYIEMIRKTADGKVEQFRIQGDRVIDGNGTWCYQIPMNLDYVMTDEFGKMVPTDNPEKGIATRTRVRFRVRLESPLSDKISTNTARYLVPNNPKWFGDEEKGKSSYPKTYNLYPDFYNTAEPDFEFGSKTKDESFRDMFWNNVYTVKSYIPRIQEKKFADVKKFFGIKKVSYPGDNNPMPYNNMSIRLNFLYRFLCVLSEIAIRIVFVINSIVGSLQLLIGWVYPDIYEDLRAGISLNGWCSDDKEYYPGYGRKIIQKGKEKPQARKLYKKLAELDNPIYIDGSNTDINSIFNCIENDLADDNECISFNFSNDWINGALYAPMWFRKIYKKSILFGSINISGDKYCSYGANGFARRMKIVQNCALEREYDDFHLEPLENNMQGSQIKEPITGAETIYLVSQREEGNCYGFNCHNYVTSSVRLGKGMIVEKETSGIKKYYATNGEPYEEHEKVYYYNPGFFRTVEGEQRFVTLFATDLVLLGNLSENNLQGIPQFFKYLDGTSFKLPPALVEDSVDYRNDVDEIVSTDEKGNISAAEQTTGNAETVMTGSDWGSKGASTKLNMENVISYNLPPDMDGGLFYSLTCNFSYSAPKSCVNLARICEFGVSLDEVTEIDRPSGQMHGATIFSTATISPDGYISFDELYNNDARSMFATMNGNGLQMKRNSETGFLEYDFEYRYMENFDGSLSKIMKDNLAIKEYVPDAVKPQNTLFLQNHKLEKESKDYNKFRFGCTYPNYGIRYYHTNDSVIFKTIESGSSSGGSGTMHGGTRFPQYENSFYFYFGLKSGKTAIDRFRKEFYSECAKDETAVATIEVTGNPNTWCADMEGAYAGENTEGSYIAVNAKGLELPASVVFNNNDTDDDPIVKDGINADKFFVGHKYVGSPVENYYHIVNVDEEGEEYFLENGRYLVTITDANGVVYNENITLEDETISVTYDKVDFVVQDSFFSGMTADDKADYIFDNIETNQNVGGYVRINSYNANGKDFKVKFSGEQACFFWNEEEMAHEMSPGEGTTHIRLRDEDGCLYLIAPESDEDYVITFIELCCGDEADDCCNDEESECENDVFEVNVRIGIRDGFTMTINGVDYSLIRRFVAGNINQNNTFDFTQASEGSVYGWNDIDNIGGYNGYKLEIIPYDAPDLTLLNAETCCMCYESDSDQAAYYGAYSWKDQYAITDDSYSDFVNANIVICTMSEYVSMYSNPDENSPFALKVVYDTETNYYIRAYNTSAEAYTYLLWSGTFEVHSFSEYMFKNNPEYRNMLIDFLNGFIGRRIEFAKSVKDAFTIIDNDETPASNDEYAKIVVASTYNPSDRKMSLQEEIYDSDDGDVIGIEPTKSTLLNENRDLRMATMYVNNAGAAKFVKEWKGVQVGNKMPYFVSVKDVLGRTKPDELTFSGFNEIDPDMNKMFGVHFLKKRFSCNPSCWSKIGNNLPNYFRYTPQNTQHWIENENDTLSLYEDDDADQFGTWSGFKKFPSVVSCEINGGCPKVYSGTRRSEFDTMALGNYGFGVYNITENENVMDARRTLCDSVEDNPGANLFVENHKYPYTTWFTPTVDTPDRFVPITGNETQSNFLIASNNKTISGICLHNMEFGLTGDIVYEESQPFNPAYTHYFNKYMDYKAKLKIMVPNNTTLYRMDCNSAMGTDTTVPQITLMSYPMNRFKSLENIMNENSVYFASTTDENASARSNAVYNSSKNKFYNQNRSMGWYENDDNETGFVEYEQYTHLMFYNTVGNSKKIYVPTVGANSVFFVGVHREGCVRNLFFTPVYDLNPIFYKTIHYSGHDDNIRLVFDLSHCPFHLIKYDFRITVEYTKVGSSETCQKTYRMAPLEFLNKTGMYNITFYQDETVLDPTYNNYGFYCKLPEPDDFGQVANVYVKDVSGLRRKCITLPESFTTIPIENVNPIYVRTPIG